MRLEGSGGDAFGGVKREGRWGGWLDATEVSFNVKILDLFSAGNMRRGILMF